MIFSMVMIDALSFWPCQFLEHEANPPFSAQYYSISFNSFDLLEEQFGGRDAGGYAIENLVKRLLKEKYPLDYQNIRKEVKFDSEASLFCAYGNNLAALHKIASLLQELAGPRNQEDLEPREEFDQNLAETALLQGFVVDMDQTAQQTFFSLVPKPPISQVQKQRLSDLTSVDAQARSKAASRMLAEACSRTRNWDFYLGDPRVTQIIMNAVLQETEEKIYLALIRTLHFIAMRHLPDLRFIPLFQKALSAKQADIRMHAVAGLGLLYRLDWEKIIPFLHDRSAKVRAQVLSVILDRMETNQNLLPGWFQTEMMRKDVFPRQYLPLVIKAVIDKNSEVRTKASWILARFQVKEAIPFIQQAIQMEKQPFFLEELKTSLQNLQQ